MAPAYANFYYLNLLYASFFKIVFMISELILQVLIQRGIGRTMNIDIKWLKLEIYAPKEYVEELRDALTLIGACRIGNYNHVISYQVTEGYWKPLEGSQPFSGEKGEISHGNEVKMEIRCPNEIISIAMKTIKKIHPYEEPVINIIPLLNGLIEFQ